MTDRKTGDVLLFSYRGFDSPLDFFSYIIEWFSPLPYSHCGIYLKDPTFLHVALKGEYIWESVINDTPDAEDNKIKWGVKITPLQDYIYKYNGSISIRSLLKDGKPYTIEDNDLTAVQKTVYGKPYDIDPMDWIRELTRCQDPTPQKTDRFWCSAFSGCFLTKIGCLKPSTDWSILRPADLAMNNLNFVEDFSLGKIKVIKK
jgi:hypothetical protein